MAPDVGVLLDAARAFLRTSGDAELEALRTAMLAFEPHCDKCGHTRLAHPDGQACTSMAAGMGQHHCWCESYRAPAGWDPL